MENIIEIKNLSKSFGEVKAVDGLSFSVKKGELFAFLGVNGAGKSTTISVMCGALDKDGGEVFIGGYDASAQAKNVRSILGVVFQQSVLDAGLSVIENLKVRASLYGIVDSDFDKKFKELSSYFGLEEIKNRAVGKLSGGQRRRVDIARALISDPEILIMDEPTTGLDPQTRKDVWKTIDALRAERNMTVFLTTHYMEEASTADYIVIIDGGKTVAEGTPLELKNKYTGDYLYVYTEDEQLVKSLGYDYVKVAEGFRVNVGSTEKVKEILIKNPEIRDFEVIKGKMDDVFLSATGKTLTGDNNENV